MPPLSERIRREILERGPISFARFMERALYDPDGGYYSRGGSRLGPGGDFYTASDVGHAFGAAIARQLQEIDRAIGPHDPFHVVEFGPGRGLLARDVLDAMRVLDSDLASRLCYVMVDRSHAMREESQRRVPEARSLAPGELGAGHHGCVLAVELFDALPVHRVRRRGEPWIEFEVTDTGAGIPDADLAQVFVPFWQGTDPKRGGPGGIGLGLVIAKQVVERHGGTISVAGRQAGGTRVRMVLPQ